MNHSDLFLARRDFLIFLGKVLGSGALVAVVNPLASWGAVADDTSLGSRAAKNGIVYGAAVMKSSLLSDSEFAAHYIKECTILVPENELKWNTLRPNPDSFDFTPADWLLEFAESNSMRYRGHALVWGDSLPGWFNTVVNTRNAEQYMRDHISTVVGHYAGKMHSWDVVNEVISPWDGRPDGLANSIWLQLLAPNYIDIAFQAAAAADPNALLVLNQNYLVYDHEDLSGFRTQTLNLIKRLQSSNIPIHALGIQGHLTSHWGNFNPESFKNFLHEVANLGLKIMITELDVTDSDLPNDIEIRDTMVAERYQDFLSVALAEPAVIAVMTWGLSDKYTWLSYYGKRADKAPVRPLPLDAKFGRKDAWNAIANVFDTAPRRAISPIRNFHQKDNT